MLGSRSDCHHDPRDPSAFRSAARAETAASRARSGVVALRTRRRQREARARDCGGAEGVVAVVVEDADAAAAARVDIAHIARPPVRGATSEGRRGFAGPLARLQRRGGARMAVSLPPQSNFSSTDKSCAPACASRAISAENVVNKDSQRTEQLNTRNDRPPGNLNRTSAARWRLLHWSVTNRAQRSQPTTLGRLHSLHRHHHVTI